MSMKKIVRNMIKCNLCGDVIESKHRHDFVTCKCGSCSVDGGNDYLRRSFVNTKDDFTELSIFEDTEEDLTVPAVIKTRDTMGGAEFDNMIQTGLEQAKAGTSVSVESAFDNLMQKEK